MVFRSSIAGVSMASMESIIAWYGVWDFAYVYYEKSHKAVINSPGMEEVVWSRMVGL